MFSWTPISRPPETNGSYLVYMPERSLDRYSVQDWDQREGSFSNDFGITHWCHLPEPPDVTPHDRLYAAAKAKFLHD